MYYMGNTEVPIRTIEDLKTNHFRILLKFGPFEEESLQKAIICIIYYFYFAYIRPFGLYYHYCSLTVHKDIYILPGEGDSTVRKLNKANTSLSRIL